MGHVSARAQPRGSIYLSINRLYGSRISPRAATPWPSTFVDDVEPTNVTSYIRRCHITDEGSLYSSVPTNI
jgi:hypothetical protein